MITAPSRPALLAMWNNGASRALRIISAPVFSSPLSVAAVSYTHLDVYKRQFLTIAHNKTGTANHTFAMPETYFTL